MFESFLSGDRDHRIISRHSRIISRYSRIISRHSRYSMLEPDGSCTRRKKQYLISQVWKYIRTPYEIGIE